MSKVKLVPLGDRVLVRQATAVDVSKGGIIIPAEAQKKPQEGEVVAIGEGRILDSGQLVPVKLKIGDRVLFSGLSGQKVVVGNESLIIFSETEIIGKLV